jgi:hypothetical protein
MLFGRRNKPGRRHVPQPRCGLCNLFMSWHYVRAWAVEWTPFGGPLDDEPPESEYAHLRCWNHADDGRRRLIRTISWIGPSFPRRAHV